MNYSIKKKSTKGGVINYQWEFVAFALLPTKLMAIKNEIDTKTVAN